MIHASWRHARYLISRSPCLDILISRFVHAYGRTLNLAACQIARNGDTLSLLYLPGKCFQVNAKLYCSVLSCILCFTFIWMWWKKWLVLMRKWFYKSKGKKGVGFTFGTPSWYGDIIFAMSHTVAFLPACVATQGRGRTLGREEKGGEGRGGWSRLPLRANCALTRDRFSERTGNERTKWKKTEAKNFSFGNFPKQHEGDYHKLQ
jgi:hypothetical protein